MIKSWSISRLKVYESCPKHAKLKYIDKIPEPDRGPPPKGEWPNDRGSRVHKQSEQFVKGERNDLVAESAAFSEEFHHLRDMHKAGKVITERMWCFNTDWCLVDEEDRENIWARFIIDALVFVTPNHAVVIDYKTGKRFGNEIDHGKQVQAYQLATFLKYPEVDLVTTELWYLDQNELATQRFTREQGLRFYKGINDRAVKMTEAEDFPSKPGRACFFCPYKTGLIGKKGPLGTGNCNDNP